MSIDVRLWRGAVQVPGSTVAAWIPPPLPGPVPRWSAASCQARHGVPGVGVPPRVAWLARHALGGRAPRPRRAWPVRRHHGRRDGTACRSSARQSPPCPVSWPGCSASTALGDRTGRTRHRMGRLPPRRQIHRDCQRSRPRRPAVPAGTGREPGTGVAQAASAAIASVARIISHHAAGPG